MLSKIKLDAVALRRARRTRLHGRFRSARRRPACSSAATATSAPAAPPSTSPSGSIRRWRRGRSTPPRSSAWTSPASTSWPPTSACRWKSRRAWSSKSTPRRGCGCTCSLRWAFPGPSARRSSPRSSPTATTGGFPSPRSPAPTARPPPRGSSPTCFAATGMRVGMTCTDGIYIDGRRIDTGDCAGPQSARAVLMNPNVDAAVFETARGGILREGLGFDRCDVAVVTNVGERRPFGPERNPHCRGPGQGQAVHRRRRSARWHVGAQCQRPALRGDGALFAGQNPLLRPGRQSSGDRAAPRASAGRRSSSATTRLSWPKAPSEEAFMHLAGVPLTRGGAVTFHVENTLAAIAAALALKVPADVVRARAESFTRRSGQSTRPVQRAGNPGGDGDRRLRPQRRRLGRADSRDGQVPAPASSLRLQRRRRPPRLRPRPPRRNPRRLPSTRWSCTRTIISAAEPKARSSASSAAAWTRARGRSRSTKSAAPTRRSNSRFAARQPGDLILVQADTVDETLAFIRRYVESIAPEPVFGRAARRTRGARGSRRAGKCWRMISSVGNEVLPELAGGRRETFFG